MENRIREVIEKDGGSINYQMSLKLKCPKIMLHLFCQKKPKK
jgi:hypothetical protein